MKKESLGVSVIIPCYNTEKYIRETLDSVLQQTFTDYEVICLDDGSTDHTLQILKEYQQNNPKIQVMTGENHGISFQRNQGVRLASGKYIYYLDSDDLIEKNCLERAYQVAERDNLDLLFFEAESFYDSEELEKEFPKFKTLYHRKKAYEGVYQGKDLYIQMENSGDLIMSVSLQFTKRQFLIDQHLCFGQIRYFEDNLYTLSVLLEAGRAECIRETLHRRRVRADSIMTMEKNRVRFESYAEIIKELLERLEQTREDEALHRAIYKRIRGTFINLYRDYRKIPKESRRDIFKEESDPLKMMADFSCYVDVSEQMRKEEASKLKRTYAEKSEINATLKKTYEEKRKRGEIIEKLKQKIDDFQEKIKTEQKNNQTLRKDLKQKEKLLKEEKENLESLKQKINKHFLVRLLMKK